MMAPLAGLGRCRDRAPATSARYRHAMAIKLPLDWRDHWQVGDDDDGLGLPHAVHDSGLAVTFIYTEVDNDLMGWCATIQAEPRRNAEGPLSDERVQQLKAEARLLWGELGYSDDSPHKRPV